MRREERNLGQPATYACFGWLPDSRKVLFRVRMAHSGQSISIVVSEPEFAVPPIPSASINCGKTSPDGQWSAVMTDTDLFVRRLTDGPWTAVTSDHVSIRSFAWAPGSESILFTSVRQGDWTLWRVSRNGGVPQRVQGPSQGVSFIRRQGSALVPATAQHDNNLVDIDLASMKGKRIFV